MHPTPPPLQGLHGDIVQVAGINTGMAKVKVRLRERAWQGVEPDIIKLLFIENMGCVHSATATHGGQGSPDWKPSYKTAKLLCGCVDHYLVA